MENTKSKQKAIQAVTFIKALFVLTNNQKLATLSDGLTIDYIWGRKTVSNKLLEKLHGIVKCVMKQNDIKLVEKAYHFVKENNFNHYDEICLNINNKLEIR